MTISDNFCNMLDAEAEPLNARQLILDLIDTDEAGRVDARRLVRAGQAFDIEGAGIRTALTRLKQDGTIEQVGRGLYAAGARGRPLHRRVAGWRDVLERRRPWTGDWLLVVAGPHERADRTIWRRTLRALELEGFAEAETNIWVRPDNLSGGVEDIRSRLMDLEAAPTLLIARASALDAARNRAFRTLWPVEALQASHLELAAMLDRAQVALAEARGAAAARTTLTLGRRAVRQIMRDPLLPDEICPQAPLAGLITAMSRFDVLGKRVWQDFFDTAPEAIA
jgi:phenylacetic acid degradation operon negative regulatory protein